MRTFTILILCIIIIANSALADMNVRIISCSGKVMVRYGLEEQWHPAASGMVLKDIDSILSGENGEVLIKLVDGNIFKLGANAFLDIADLRAIQEKELFLYLMSNKIDKIPEPVNKAPLKIADVSVVHGSLSKINRDSSVVDSVHNGWYVLEKNGAIALFLQKFYTNSIVKLYKIIDKYGSHINEGELYYFIAKGFDALNKKGQAIDAYSKSLDYFKKVDDTKAKIKIAEIEKNIENLKQ